MCGLYGFLYVRVVNVILVFCAAASASRDLRPRRAGFVVRGRVWCDTCLAGFETPASTYIAGN
jgi:hypothetical protein